MSQTKALYRLQTLDLDLEAQRKQLRAIKDRLEQDETLRQAQSDVATLEATLHPQETKVTALNLEIQSLVTQDEQASSRLYGSSGNNPKEIKDLEGKLAELKRRRSLLDNTLLETMIAVEDLQTSLAQARQHLAQIEHDLSAEHKALRAQGHELQQAIKRLKEAREAALKSLDPETLALYDGMRVAKRGHVISPLDGESCSICGVGQTTTLAQKVRQGHEMIVCSNCGRILIAL